MQKKAQKKITKRKPVRRIAPKKLPYPKSAKRLLGLLGVKPGRVSSLGFEHIKRGILSMAEKAMLTKREKQVIGRRLNGSELKGTAIDLDISKGRVLVIEKSAANKINYTIINQMTAKQKRITLEKIFGKKNR